ncbi:proprotein convertase subtilisin/kexin type 5-like [Coregonus clupeaformis]|uniref:proprotein convertase subtilisin/kexin type 5-like n=1 Tax=Coregonus clupeaformis TaxID=59861 RepID=UPI001E1C3F7D|nr:proprotein convertase subtilisin/kexin type 5-like [Coregonus clupeaformis]
MSCVGRHSVQCAACKPSLFKQGRSCVETCGDRTITSSLLLSLSVSHFGNTTTGTCDRCDPSCGKCSGRGSGDCLNCRDGYLYLKQSGQCLQTCPTNYFPDTRAKICRKCHPTCKTCKDEGALFCKSCFEGFRFFGGICDSPCLVGLYAASAKWGSDPQCENCDPSCLACKGPGQWNCTVCPASQLLADDGRCLSCCGNETRHDGSPLPWECCDCRASNMECVFGVNFVFRGIEELPEGHPKLFILATVLLVSALGAAVFLFLRTRSKAGAGLPQTKANGYKKLGANGDWAGSGLDPASSFGDYSDRIVEDDGEEEDDDNEDIVYMGQDGTVYRKFKYGLLEEDEEIEMEYDDESYSFR